MYQLPATRYFMLIGIMLSDGYISIQKSSGPINGYFELQQSFDKFYYVFHVFSFIGHYCNKMPKLKIKNWLSAGKQKQHLGLRIVTRALPCFTELHDLFYIKGKKCIPTNIYYLLNPIYGPLDNGRWFLSTWRFLSFMYRFFFFTRCNPLDECSNGKIWIRMFSDSLSF
jgi:hypothetical protein